MTALVVTDIFGLGCIILHRVPILVQKKKLQLILKGGDPGCHVM